MSYLLSPDDRDEDETWALVDLIESTLRAEPFTCSEDLAVLIDALLEMRRTKDGGNGDETAKLEGL